MRFETPKMNISMFEVENVVTIASGNDPASEPLSAKKNATELAQKIQGVNAVLEFE